ncbi:hypothetical protein [Streptomyces sp. NPDC002889]|uniref:hypothetical protein n=1 Tax=Streptomyces sp. NPDC002889 TaxID=3364669 RepID=UPI0036BCDD3B
MTFGGQGPYRPPWPPNGAPPPPYGPPVPLWRRLREDEWPPLREVLGHGRRIHGCVWAMLLLCVWPALFLLVAYPLARSARRKARAVFPVHSHRRIQDPEVMRVQKVRAWTALGASCVIMVAYGTSADWQQAQDQVLFRLAITPWLLLLTAPAVIAILFRLAPPSARPVMRARLRPAVRSVLWYFGAFTAVPILFAGVMLLSRYLRDGVLDTLISFALLLPILWVTFFVGFASATVVRTAFNTADVHAVLPALLTGVLVWELAAINLSMAGPPPGPPLIQICAILGGPASVTAVAWWEIVRLRTRYGVTLRS